MGQCLAMSFSSRHYPKMNDPLVRFRNKLRSLSDIKERMTFTEQIKAELSEVKAGDWKTLHRCEADGTYWVEEYPLGEIHGGGPSCLYFIESDDPITYFDSGPYLTVEIRKENERKVFWNTLGDENGKTECKSQGCDRNSIKHSVFCKRHHYERIMKEPCPF